MKKLVSTLIVMSLFAATPVFAQVRRDQVEKATDRQEIRQDKVQTRDDKADLYEMETLLRRFDKARARRQVGKLNGIDAELRRLLHNELAEGRVETTQKNAEAGRSAGELGSDRRELRADAATGAPAPVVADDLRDRRDDRKDLADDQRDAAVKASYQQVRVMVARELNPLLGRQDARSLDRKRALVVQLIDAARAEVALDRQEKREDKRELKEDRKETREDVRQGR